MNLHEYQAKEILNQFGVAIQRGKVAETVEEVAEAVVEAVEDEIEIVVEQA